MRLELLSIAGAVATILIIPTALSAQGGAVNAVAAARGAVVRGVPTSADLGTSSSSSFQVIIVTSIGTVRLPQSRADDSKIALD